MYKILCSLILNITILLFSSILIADENKILFKINNEIVTSIDLLNEINYLKSINNDFKNLENNTYSRSLFGSSDYWPGFWWKNNKS